jgi:hypothetical protein
MNDRHREKLKAVLEEILQEESDTILAETRVIMAELIQKEYLPKIEEVMADLIESSTRKKPADYLTSIPPVPGTSDCKGDEPLMEKIQSLNQNKTGGSGTGTGSDGLYVYGIAENADAAVDLRAVGIDWQPVYVIPFKNLAAIVHTCPLAPYRNDDESVMRGWVLAHQKVLEIAAGRCGTVVPFGFDTIIMPDGDRSAKEVLLSWIAGEYDHVQKKMDKIRGKKEYGIQVFGSVPAIIHRVTSTNETIRVLQDEIKNTTPGKAYMVRQKMEQELKKGIESHVDGIARTCHRKITAACDDIKVEKIKKTNEKDTRMLLNYSCLVSDEKYSRLGEVLESLESEDGLTVRFTGPWPAYSFV